MDAPAALVVEDEPHIRELVTLHLSLEGLGVTQCADGEEALRLATTETYQVIVLDLMLPKLDGLTVCRAIRRSSRNSDTPILMLTARREETDKVLGLESGADDYLTKPFGVRELVARVRALMRRPRQRLAEGVDGVIEVGDLRVDPAKRQVTIAGRATELTPHEFEVLLLLASRPGVVFSRQMLLNKVWREDTHVTDRSVDTLIKRLRQKIEPDNESPSRILTVWGTGYKFTDA
ncbi:MAG: response regulator transcription factor [Acidobacteria bacterium]|jgi:two-component system, OmpR family, alkaline phosphatase synthesis response regulator PhoP|nr:response regulator transcription factor [Acidobacteriota bacterium]